MLSGSSQVPSRAVLAFQRRRPNNNKQTNKQNILYEYVLWGQSLFFPFALPWEWGSQNGRRHSWNYSTEHRKRRRTFNVTRARAALNETYCRRRPKQVHLVSAKLPTLWFYSYRKELRCGGLHFKTPSSCAMLFRESTAMLVKPTMGRLWCDTFPAP